MLAPLEITKLLLPRSCHCPACPHSCSVKLFPHSYRCWLNFVFIVCSPSLCNRLHLGSWHHIIQAWTFVWIALIKFSPSNENKALPVLFQLSLIFLLFFFFPLFFWCSALWTLFFSPYQYFLPSLYHRPLTPATAAVVGRLSSQGLLKIEAERERQRERVFAASMVRK